MEGCAKVEKTIFITASDKEKLEKLIKDAREYNLAKKEYIYKLEQELLRAKVVKPEETPNDVITMNSQVSLIDLETGEEMIYTLVFPDQADLSNNKISIFAPIGTAILGCKVNDVIEWQVPGGVAKFRVNKILYQPEAAGDFGL
ncbi:MAG TPA: nucleoside diphosphate kinase regulator [Peptococcaceae bacterium]|nr:nucleoside diphosphate kinase regulator [Peptococcaceae bacterium]